ncbi:cytochrome c oxidase assembly protein COX18, mitochondrial [Microplitis demolitor]|uniref:cytochrome c oxidase assembly protein COX18, mitochondrial n=1 Tax=Microplitis demolitor TaxID=69319 RepID=UPI0006D5250F|nr:cytochrome c oxidase assembly protein COX18, mitochondrial [Microplitis demolitor]
MYNLKLQRIIINDYKILIRKKNFGSVNEGFKNCRSICLQNNLNFNKLKNEDGLGRSNGLFKCKNVNINNKLYQSRTYASSPLPLDDTDFSPPIVRYEGIMKLFVDSPPIEFCQESLVSLHSSTGLPWWATIVLVTCTGRTLVTLPCALYQQYIFAKLTHLKYEMNEIVKDLKHETNVAVTIYGWTEAYGRSVYNRSLKKQWNKLIIRDNCHPMKGLILMLAQVPLWVILSASFRNLCFMLPQPTTAAQQTFLELSVEGFGWISNLTAVDSYYILPILVGVFTLANIEIVHMLKTKDPSKTQKFSLYFGRAISLIIVPLACIVPSGMSLYWTTSSAYSIFQNLLIVSPKFRRFSRIPETEEDREHPYRFLFDKIKKRIGLKNS